MKSFTLSFLALSIFSFAALEGLNKNCAAGFSGLLRKLLESLLILFPIFFPILETLLFIWRRNMQKWTERLISAESSNEGKFVAQTKKTFGIDKLNSTKFNQ